MITQSKWRIWERATFVSATNLSAGTLIETRWLDVRDKLFLKQKLLVSARPHFIERRKHSELQNKIKNSDEINLYTYRVSVRQRKFIEAQIFFVFFNLLHPHYFSSSLSNSQGPS